MKLEPSQIQKYDAGVQGVVMLRFIFGVIIDLKLIKKRKWFVVSTCVGMVLANIILWSSTVPSTYFYVLCVDMVFRMTNTSIKDIWQVEQSRKDIKYGQGDIQSLNNISGTLGNAAGSIVATCLCEYKVYYAMFPINAAYVILLGVAAAMMDQEIDENEFATGKD